MSESHESDRSISGPRGAALGWLYGRINYERSDPIPYSEQGMKLDRVRHLLRELGDPQDALRVVHIAGTKGKGAVAEMVSRALLAADYRVGAYTSPHVDRFEERIAFQGRPCTAEQLIALTDRARAAVEKMERRGEGSPTFFDIATAMALLGFAEAGVDVAVIEVGLGGRLDSTNVVTPAVCAITSISFDHTEQLGDTLALIAAEKAGICKPGAALVSGVTDAEPARVIAAKADEAGSPLRQYGRDYEMTPADECYRFVSRRSSGDYELTGVRPGLPGGHNARNAAVALETLTVLAEGFPRLTDEKLREGVATAKPPVRMERLATSPPLVVDAAHNRASACALAESLDELTRADREHRVLILSVSREKDLRGILEELVPRFRAIVVTRYLENPRAVPIDELHQEVKALLTDPQELRSASTPSDALRLARQLLAGSGGEGPRGAIVATGSLFLAAEVRRLALPDR